MILYIAIYKRLSGRDPGDFHRYQLRTWHSLYQKAGISLFLPRITGIPDLFSSRLFSFSVARSPFHDLYAHVLALRVILAFKLRVLHPVLSLSFSQTFAMHLPSQTKKQRALAYRATFTITNMFTVEK